MKTSTKLLSMFSAFCAILFLGMSANAQSITVVPGLTATQMAQTLVGSNVTVTNATYTGATNASGSFNQASSTFPLSDGIILTSGAAANAVGPNNATGSSASNGTGSDPQLASLVPGFNIFDAAVLEFDITSNCNTVTFDYIFASEEYLEYGCSSFNDAFGFFISGPGYAANTNIALVPGTTTPVSINNVINSPATNCVSNPAFYVDNAGGVSIQYDGYTVTLTATASIQPCQTYHIKIAVGDAGDSALDSAVFLKGGGINCTSPSLATTANITDVTCGSLGSIDLSVNSGTGPFTYAWTGPNGFTATTEDLSGLDAGTYTVDIVGSDCLSSGQATFTVTEAVDVTPPVFTNCPSDLVIEAANNACAFSVNVLNNVTVTDDCGVTSITTSHDSTFVFGVGTTPVTVTAMDAAGNTSTCNFNVIINAQPLVVTLTPFQYNGGVNIRCFGQNSGRVTAGASGGCAPYTFTWSSGFPLPYGPPNTSTCVGLFAGVVTCTVTDAAGTSVTETVTLVENPPVVVTPVWTPIQCFGGQSTVTINAQAGTAPYNGLTVTNVFAGTYEYVVADANGCRAYDTITITQPDILDAAATPEPILCYGDSTTVNVAATGGTTPYIGTGPIGVVAGVYSFDVIDANGCTDNVQLAVNQPGQLSASISATPILCYGGTSQVTVGVASGTEPYAGAGVFTEQAGWHTYTVYDFNLCEDTIGILITQPDPMVASAVSTPILCNGDSTTITVTGSGGTGAWTGTGTFVELAGTYGYSFLDANGCTDSISITVSEPSALSASISATSIDCNGGSADITVSATGGTAPYTGTGVYSVAAGTYTYTITDANGCSETVSITVSEPTALSASISATSIDCNGGSADITVSASGGTAPYTGTGVYSVTAGTYTYTVTDANGCSETVSITVSEPTALSASISATSIDCNGGSADVTVSATGGTAPYTGTGVYSVAAGTYTYTVTDANGCSETVSITVTEPTQLVASISATSIDCNGGSADVTVSATGGTAPYTGTGVYSVTAGTYTYTVTDANGCSETVSIAVTEPTQLVASISATSIDCNGGSADVTVSATGGTAPYTGTGVYSVTAGTYTYTVTDANGCSETVSITVTEPTVLSASASAAPYSCVTGVAAVSVSATGGTAPYAGVGTFNEGLGTYTYTITDANGCTATASATVTEIPASITIVGAPTDATVECDAVPTAPTVTAVGTNGENINVTYTENILGSGCSYQIVRTWTAVDSCGNQMVSTQTLDVQDTQAPVINCPADYTIDCNNPFIPLSDVVVTTTDCSNNVTTSVSDSIVTGSAFASATTIYRTITAADDCGNVSSCVQVISGTVLLTEGECKKCDTEINIVVDPFNPSCVYVEALCKDLSNVVLGDINGWEYKFDGLNGYTGYFCHPSGLPITDVWVKAGCFRSGDGPGYGHHFEPCSTGGPNTGTPTYEPSAGLNTSYEWIDNVTLGSINNLSGNNGGYADFSTLATGALVGDVISVQLTPGFTGMSYDEYWRVWIDWNNDGDFLDQDEQVYQNNWTGVLNGSFTVPQTALTDTDLKVRVAMKWDAYSAPNEMFQYGEVEDYTIYIQSGGTGAIQTTIGSLGNDKGVKQEGASKDVKSNEVFENEPNSGYGIELGDVYPNPVLSANGKFNLDIRTSMTDVTIRIVDLSGRVVLTEEMYLGIGANKCQLDVTGFTRGSYLIEVLSGDSKETTQLVVQ